jgi:hypothetical protein
MFDNIYYSETKVKICTNITYSFLSLSYEIEDKDEDKIEVYLSDFLPFCDSGLVKIKDENSIAIQWSKDILKVLGYEEEQLNVFVLKSEPQEVSFSHAIMYVPSNYKEIGRFKNILYNTFGKQLTFWPFVSLNFPFNLRNSNKGGSLNFGDSTKLKYDIVNVIEAFIEQLKQNTIAIETGLEIQTSLYGRTKYDAYYLQNTHLIRLNVYEGDIMPPKLIYKIHEGFNSISLKYCHNVPQEFIDELKAEVDKNSSIRISPISESRIDYDKNVQPSKLIDSIKQLAKKHSVLIRQS